MSKASFVVMASPPDTYSAGGRRRLRSSRTTATEILAVVSAIAMTSFSFQSLMRELWYGMALRRLHRSAFDCFCSKECIRAASKGLPDFTCQLRTVQLTALAYGRSQPRH